MIDELPIEACLPDLISAVSSHTCTVLTAPPGAGKTTRVPCSLLNEAWCEGQKIIMLEPRRVAARHAAARLSELLGEKVGHRVGFQVRGERVASSATRILVVTEGVLTRMLQTDPELPDVALVIFDEFHERSIHADLGLALLLQSQALLRPELKLLVMSATIDADAVAALLGNAPIVRSEGRQYDVQTCYRPLAASVQKWTRALAEHCGKICVAALQEHAGDVLIFLPGIREIRELETALRSALVVELQAGRLSVCLLYGSQSLKEQQVILQNVPVIGSESGTRRIILATNIAQTSLTLQGVSIVIDSGLAKVAKFDPRTGMDRLRTIPISRDAADQRQGRAGRLEAGFCYRLWSESTQRYLPAQTQAEILHTDLSSLCLELAAWGVTDPTELLWLDIPPSAAFDVACELLKGLAALDARGQITAHGRLLAALPVSPRIANMLVRATELGLQEAASLVAALLEERDIFSKVDGIDWQARLDHLLQAGSQSTQADARRVRKVRRRAQQLNSLLAKNKTIAANARVSDITVDRHHVAGLLLALVFPDRIAMRQPVTGRFLMVTGTAAQIPESENLFSEHWLAIGGVDQSGSVARVFGAAAVSEEIVEYLFAEQIGQVTRIGFSEQSQRIVASVSTQLGAVQMTTRTAEYIEADVIDKHMIAVIQKKGFSVLPVSARVESLLQRIQFVRQQIQQHETIEVETDGVVFPDFSEAALLQRLDRWLLPYLRGMTRLSELAKLDLHALLLSELSWPTQQKLEVLAPVSIKVPSGSLIAIDYSNSNAPVLAVRMQEMFGASESPTIACGRVTLVLHLLSPARRPLQVTRDLAGFWKGSYSEIRKEMRSRYQKHYWPEDPVNAEATTRIKRNMKSTSSVKKSEK